MHSIDELLRMSDELIDTQNKLIEGLKQENRLLREKIALKDMIIANNEKALKKIVDLLVPKEGEG